ncbi:MAG: RDD family protein [Candidatus Omnitrophota bacterium]
MSYNVRINGQIISVASLNELKDRAIRWQRLKLNVEVAETNSQVFVPLEQYLKRASSPGGMQCPNQSFHPPQNMNAASAGVHPSMFNQRTGSINNQPFFNQNVTLNPQPSPAQQVYIPNQPSGIWHVEPDAHLRLWQFIKPEHMGHQGPWLVSGDDLIPIAGYWITGAARIIDIFLFVITLGIYGIAMARMIAQGRQTAGQKIVGIRMVRSKEIHLSPGYGQIIGLFIFILLTYVPLLGMIIGIGMLFQAFTERKQGLHHKVCGVMHIEVQHYGAGRGAAVYLISGVLVIVMYIIGLLMLFKF